MKVLHIIPSVSERSGGPAAAIIPMCRSLQTQDVEVVLVTTNAGLSAAEISAVGEASNYKGVETIFFPSKLESFKYSRPLSAWLSAHVRAFDLVHIHAVFNHACMAAARACRKFGVPYVVRPLGTLDPWSMKQKTFRKRLFWILAGKEMLQGAAAVHYTTQTEKAETENLLALNHGKVIALGIDPNTVACSGNGDNLAQHFPSLSLNPYVLVLSRLHPKKGLEVLLDAFFSLLQQPKFARWRLVLAGDGPAGHVALLQRKVASSHYPEKVLFTGWLDGERKEAVLSGASLLALPSHQENFGLCVMEALAHAVPVLLSPHVNLASEIEMANAGWIAAVEREALAARLVEALSDEEELSRRGRAGKLLSENYSWERAAMSLADLYRDILRRRQTIK